MIANNLSIVNTQIKHFMSIYDTLYKEELYMKIIANNYKSNEIIKIIREWTELTQKEFGKTINRSRDSINNLENGRNKYYFTTLMEIAKKHNLIITIEKK